MAENLRARLARARELSRAAQGGASRFSTGHAPGADAPVSASSENAVDSASGLSGWTEVAPWVLSRSLRFPNPLPPELDMRPYLWKSPYWNTSPGEGEDPLDARGRLKDTPSERIVFFDLETTGLSGGAGTVAFLAALGRVLPGADALEVRQYFLMDYPGEADFLDALIRSLRPGDILGSYNGRSFDEPLLRTRCVLNRVPWPSLLHADFLHVARRLWRRRLTDCSLGTLEECLLGKRRDLDVPSSRIPSIWFSFLKAGHHPLMNAVAAHNAADVETLAGIAALCDRINRNPQEAEGCDLVALGTLWLGLEADSGTRTLERAFEEGDEKAGWILLHEYRRTGNPRDYERILDALPPSLPTWVERAKHAEHRKGDIIEAIQAVHMAKACASEAAVKESLDHRLARLERKLACAASGGSLLIPLPEDRRAPRR